MKRLLVITAAILAITACKKDDTQQRGAMPPPAVIVEKISTENVYTTDNYVGKLEAVAQAAITARVSGYLEKILAHEGDQVKKDQVIFSIEKGQYQTAVRQAEASLAQARATSNNTRAQRERARVLVESNSIARATYDDAVAADQAAQANVAAAQAAVETARLNLQYTEVASPIDGRVGLVTYNVGETVGPSSGTIVQVIAPDPMYVYFSVSDRQLQELRGRYSDLMNDVSLDLLFTSGFTYPEKGKINFVDNTVSGSTDSIRIRGVIGNPNGVLTSGQTMTVGVTSNVEQTVVTVPQAAIINDIGNKYVLLIDGESKVQRRNIVTGNVLASGRQIVTQGLANGDTIVVDGIQKAAVGAVVTPLTQDEYNAMIQQQMAGQQK